MPEELNLAVSPNNLLEDWQTQATMMYTVGEQLADAQQEEDECRAELAVVAAEVDQAIRANPGKYNVAKVTEAAVAAAIPATQEHQAATKALRDARYAVRIAQAAVNAVQHRKSTLQGMTELWLRQYYADPKSPDQPAPLRDAATATKSIEGRRPRKPRRR